MPDCDAGRARRNDVARKKAGDAVDLFALSHRAFEVIADLNAADYGLVSLVRAELARTLTDDADVATARIRAAAPEVVAATAANVRAVAERICSQL